MSLGDAVAELTLVTQSLQSQVTNTLAECCGTEASHFINQVTLNVPSDYATLEEALSFLAGKDWSVNGKPTIQLPAGTINLSNTAHIYKSGIKIKGAGMIEKTISGHPSSTPIDSAYKDVNNNILEHDIVLTLNDTTELSVGMYGRLSNLAPAALTRTDPPTSVTDNYAADIYAGCGVITAISGNDITLRIILTTNNSGSGIEILSGNFSAFKTQIKFPVGISGFKISSREQNSILEDLIIVGERTTTEFETIATAITIKEKSCLELNNIGIVNIGIGIKGQGNSSLIKGNGFVVISGLGGFLAAGTTGEKRPYFGIYLTNSAYAQIDGVQVVGNAETHAVYCQNNSTVSIQDSIISSNFNGCISYNGSMIRACDGIMAFNENIDCISENHSTFVYNKALLQNGNSYSPDDALSTNSRTGNNGAVIIFDCNNRLEG